MNAKSLVALVVALAIHFVQAKDEKPVAAQPIVTETLNVEKGELEWRFKNQKLLVYAFATNQIKPYVRELYTLRGENVLRDSPPDHFHHHGLMYAIRVNGVNFWEEKTEPGFEKSIKLRSFTTRGRQAKFTQTIHWVASTNNAVVDSAKVALLIEHRTLSLTVNEASDEVALTWESKFDVGPATTKAKLQGTDYNGLGMRLPQSFDHFAKFQNSENAIYSAPNTRNVVAGKWSSVAGTVDGHDITVAIFGDAANKSGNHFFTLLDPFAYFGVTQALDKQPLEHARGEKFHVRYLVLVYSQPKTAEFLNRRYERWTKQKK